MVTIVVVALIVSAVAVVGGSAVSAQDSGQVKYTVRVRTGSRFGINDTFTLATTADTPPQGSDAKCRFAYRTIIRTRSRFQAAVSSSPVGLSWVAIQQTRWTVRRSEFTSQTPRLPAESDCPQMKHVSTCSMFSSARRLVSIDHSRRVLREDDDSATSS
jgi:hypothetical protein